MRKFLPAILLCVWLPAVALADASEATLMAQAQRAFIGSDYSTAKELFGEVLEMDPHNTLAINFLRTIRTREAGLPDAAPKDPLKTLVIASVDFKSATFSAALDFLKQKAAAQSVNVSFVTQLPQPLLDRQVTLNLTQVPFLEALRYLCQLDGATYKIERFAIVISPAPAPDAAASPAPSAQ